MDEFYRAHPPTPIDQLAQSEVDFDLAVESLFYYQVHQRPSRWNMMVIAMRKWFDLVRLLRSENLSHTGYDYPDWRQFALLDLAMPTREILRTRLRWYNKVDYGLAGDLVEDNQELLDQKEVLSNLAHIRVGLKSDIKKIHRDLYIISLLHCKYRLIKSSADEHDALLPIYNNLYSLFLVKFDLHPAIFRNNSFWSIHSTLCLFPHEIGKLDVGTFQDRTRWLIHSI